MKPQVMLLQVFFLAAELLSARPLWADSPAVDSTLREAIGSYYGGAYAHVIDLLQPSSGTPLPAKAAYYLGSSFAALNDPQSAIRYLRMAVDSPAAEIAWRFQLAKSLSAYGASEDARREYRRVLAADSAFLPALFNLGTMLFDGRDFAGAADLFARAIRFNPRDYLSYYNLAASLVNLGRPDSALQFLRASTALNSRYVPALNLLASLYYKRKEFQDAERLYGMIVARDSANADAWARRGYCLDKLKNPGRAAYCFRSASLLDTANSTYAARLGQSYFELKSYDSAAVAYLHAAGLEEENPVLYLNAGLAYASADSPEQALDAFHRSALASHTERLGLLYGQIAGVYYKEKRFRRAARAYVTALRYDPGNSQAVFFLAHAREELKDSKGAAEAYRRFLALPHGNDPERVHLVSFARKRLTVLSPRK
jgi:tetratricopeptide (TPR) repeat protein